MTIIKFTPKEKWIVRDENGTFKIFRIKPVRVGSIWTGKGCQVLAEEKTTGLNIAWKDEPVRIIEHRAIEVCDFSII